MKLLLLLVAMTPAWWWTYHYEWTEYKVPDDGFTLSRPGTLPERLRGHKRITISLPSGTIIRVPHRVMDRSEVQIIPDKGTARAMLDNFVTPDSTSRDTLEVGTPQRLASVR